MNEIAIAIQNEVLDEIAYRIYGQTDYYTEELLRHNPHLAEMPIHLPLGTKIKLLPSDKIIHAKRANNKRILF